MNNIYPQQDLDQWQYPGMALHELFDELRQRGPIVPVNFLGSQSWLITEHATLQQALKDGERFPPHLPYQFGIEPVIGETFQTMTGDRHRFYRKLATPTFRPRSIERMDSTMLADVADELIGQFYAAGETDLVSQFTERYPHMVIARLLGIPREEEEQFGRWVGGILNFRWDPDEAMRCRDELWQYLDPVIAQRTAEPADDVISALIHDEVDGARMTPEQVKSHIGIMFTAGSSTTHDSIGNLLYALLATDDCWQQVRENAELRDQAIEEALRWEPAVTVLPRMAAEETVEFCGATIAPHSFVLFGISAANHDPAIYADPHRFDIHRNSEDMMTFGPGPRMCPGMHLARKELRITLDAIIDRLPKLELLDQDSAQPRGTVFRNPKALQVRF